MADNLTELTADIVSAYVEHNSVAASDLPALIKSTHAALSGIGEPVVEATEAAPKATVAQVRKSLTPDKLISFIDGKGYSLLKRHLAETVGVGAKGRLGPESCARARRSPCGGRRGSSCWESGREARKGSQSVQSRSCGW